MASWLDRQLPDGVRIFSSCATRCEQTVRALGRKYKLREELAPHASAAHVLEVAQWPNARQPIVLVGHQPWLGEVIAGLLALRHNSCSIRKGAVWWLHTRERDGHSQTVLLSVQTPDKL